MRNRGVLIAVAVMVVSALGAAAGLSLMLRDAGVELQKLHAQRCARIMPLAKTHADTMQLARVDGCDFRAGGAR